MVQTKSVSFKLVGVSNGDADADVDAKVMLMVAKLTKRKIEHRGWFKSTAA